MLNGSGNNQMENQQGVTLLTLMQALRRRLFYVLIPTLLSTAGLTAVAFYLPPRYRAQVVLAAEPMVGQNFLGSVSPIVNIQQQLLVIRETLDRRSLLEELIRKFGLYPPQDGSIPESTLEDLTSRIDIRVEGAETFSIAFTGEGRQQVAEIANWLGQRFIQERSASREWRAEATAGFLDAEVERLRNKLAEQEEKIQQYKQGSIHELPEYLETNLRLLQTLQEQLQRTAENIAREEATGVALRKEIEQLEQQGVLRTEEPHIKSPADLKLEDLKLELRKLRKKYTEQHPEVIRLQREIQDLEKTVSQETKRGSRELSPMELRYIQVQAELEAADRRLKSSVEERQALNSQLAIYQRRIDSVPRHARTLGELVRDYEATRSRYEDLLKKGHEARLVERLEELNRAVVFRIIEPARVPVKPDSPKHYRLVLMGILSGLGLGVVLAFLAEQMDTSFDTVEDFRKFTDLPVLAAIPTIAGSKLAPKRPRVMPRGRPELKLYADGQSAEPWQPHIVALADPHSIASEQYRVLAMKLRQHLSGTHNQAVMITSTAGGDGKTTTAVNSAVALSELPGNKVLLVDADLRKPAVHTYLGLSPSKGFCDLLAQPDEDFSHYVQMVKSLYVITNRGEIADPVAALSSSATHHVLERLREHFNYIVIDSPPIVPLADGHILAELVDGVILVARARSTRRELFQHALKSFETDKLLGVILNDLYYSRSRYAYAYDYYRKHYQLGSGGGR